MTHRGVSNESGHARQDKLRAPLALPVSLAFTLMAAGSAHAQHAQTVLMGDPNEAGLALPAERTAVHPISAPYYNEDAFVTSDLRFWYVNHQFPGNSALGGADASVYALQVRAALTESLQFVAYKDGFIDFSDPVDESGMNDLAAGLKWAFLQDWERDMHAAVGIGYEFATGDAEVLQDDEEVRVWASYNNGVDRWHFGANVNLTWGVGDEDSLGDSDRLSWHLHADYFVNQSISPVVEVNGYSTLSEGDNRPLPFNGVDVANLGGGDGEDVVTAVIGTEFRPADGFALRLGYESPLTDNEDLFGYRWTFSAIWGF